MNLTFTIRNILILILIYFNIATVVNADHKEYWPQQTSSATTQDAISFLQEYDREALEMCNRITNLKWRLTQNGTDYNKRRYNEQLLLGGKFQCISWQRLKSMNINTIQLDNNFKQQIIKIKQFSNYCGLGDTKFLELQHILNRMKDHYYNTKICPIAETQATTLINSIKRNHTENYNYYLQRTINQCDIKVNEIMLIMENSRSEYELRYMWIAWHNAASLSIRNTYMRYLDLMKQSAQIQGYHDAGDQMRSIYNDKNFYFTIHDFWLQIQPLYKQLFTYIRRQLIQYYKLYNLTQRSDGPIPVHLLGSLSGHNWKSLLKHSDNIIPLNYWKFLNINQKFIYQGYSKSQKFLQDADEYLTSLGMPAMLPEFWRNSIQMNYSNNINSNEYSSECNSLIWDFCNNIDFRIIQCSQIDLNNYIDAHIQLTKIQTFMQNSNQPYVYKSNENSVFHEALAQTIGLTVSNPLHLQRKGFLISKNMNNSDNYMLNIEYLLNLALEKLPLLGFSYSLEKWRWYVFEKGPEKMNSYWWELQLRYMGIIPPISRTNENFDPGANYQILMNQEYMKSFLITILQFQIFDELCNQLYPNQHPDELLHNCDLYRSRDVGRILMNLMEKGTSVSLEELIRILTKNRTSIISTASLLRYFKPLELWLIEQNRHENVIGWNINLDDLTLFQRLYHSNGTNLKFCNFSIYFVIFFIIMQNFT